MEPRVVPPSRRSVVLRGRRLRLRPPRANARSQRGTFGGFGGDDAPARALVRFPERARVRGREDAKARRQDAPRDALVAKTRVQLEHLQQSLRFARGDGGEALVVVLVSSASSAPSASANAHKSSLARTAPIATSLCAHRKPASATSRPARNALPRAQRAAPCASPSSTPSPRTVQTRRRLPREASRARVPRHRARPGPEARTRSRRARRTPRPRREKPAGKAPAGPPRGDAASRSAEPSRSARTTRCARRGVKVRADARRVLRWAVPRTARAQRRDIDGGYGIDAPRRVSRRRGRPSHHLESTTTTTLETRTDTVRLTRESATIERERIVR